jgi:hypothetical protein
LLFALVLLAGITPLEPFGAPVYAANSLIFEENQQPGSSQWRIPTSRSNLVADDTNNQIKGYASVASVNKGSSISFHVTVNPSQPFTIDIFRMGFYQGLGGRLMQHVNPIKGVAQPACPVVDVATHLVACSWPASYSMTIPRSWTDGIYLVVLTNANLYQNYITFVVRDDTRRADLLFQQSVNTYQAYNDWGGYSLYSYNSLGKERAYKVSFDRPYEHDGSGDLFGWEVYFVKWAEQQGYDLTYSTDVDTAANPARLLSVKGFLVVGHDEYWTKEMYDAAEHARDAGVSLGFFGGNDIYWQARYEASAKGVANRVLVSYKTSDTPNSTDPITASYPRLTTDRWRNPLPNRPEQSLMGVMYSSQVGRGWDSNVSNLIINSSQPIYARTGFADGSNVAGIVGYEADRWFPEYPSPSHQSYTLLSRSPYTDIDGSRDYSNSVIYQALNGSWVFATGTMGWNYALGRPGLLDVGIQQTTMNVLNLFVSNVPVPVSPTPAPTPSPTPVPLSSGYRDALHADAPIGYWRLDETDGLTAQDWEQSNVGTYINGPTLGHVGALAGDPGFAVSFNGVNQYLNIPFTAALNPTTFSVEAWANPTEGTGTYRGVMASRYYPYGWVMYAGSDNNWQFWINDGSGMLTVSGGTVTLNAWTHLVGTFDGTTALLYVNGALVGSGTVAKYQPQTDSALTIGQGEPDTALFFPGTIDEPAIYGSALSPSQVMNHFRIGTHGAVGTPHVQMSPVLAYSYYPPA